MIFWIFTKIFYKKFYVQSLELSQNLDVSSSLVFTQLRYYNNTVYIKYFAEIFFQNIIKFWNLVKI